MNGLNRLILAVALALVAIHGGRSLCFAAAKIYVPNYDAGSVSVIDTATCGTLTTIGVAASPIGVAASRDGQRVYVAGHGSGTISVIDTLSDRVVASFTVSGTVNGLALSPLGNRLYVTEKDGGTVRVLDTADGSLLATVPGMADPVSLLVSPDGTSVFASNQRNGAVTIISTADNSSRSISLGGTLGGMALNTDGSRLYVAKSSANSVVVINTATNGVIWMIPVGLSPRHVAVSPDGRTLYVADTGSNTVSIVDTATFAVIDTIATGVSPDGLALNPSGDRLHVLNSTSGSVSVIDTAAKTVVATVGTGSRPRAYGSFIAAAPSRIYVANSGGNGIMGLDPAASGNAPLQQTLSGAATTLDGPAGVAVFGSEIVVANGNRDSIAFFRKHDNGAAAPVRTIAGNLTRLSGPEQLLVDGHEIFVANSDVDGHLTVFNLTDGGNTAPKRELTSVDQVASLAVYGDELYLGRTGSSGDSDTLFVFDRSATGAATPLRTLSGMATGLASIGGIAVYKDEIHVANAAGNSITVYNRTDAGNAAPKRSISGGSTQLDEPRGIIVIGDELFVANSGGGNILVFDRTASGNVTPKRVIQGDRTGLTGPSAIAVESAWEPMIPMGPSLYGPAFTYDSTAERAIVNGGSSEGGVLIPSALTWIWNGSSWSSINTGNPAARLNGSMTHHPSMGRTILFGGWAPDDTYLGENWNLSGTTWSLGSYGTAPAARANAASAFDPARNQLILFGGAGPGLFNDTWSLEFLSGYGYYWQQKAVAGPAARHFSRMAFDAARNVMVLFGGQDGFPGSFLQDTWEWNGSSWSRKAEYGPGSRAAQAMAYDPVRRRVVMYGGGGWGATEFKSDTWEWSGGQWFRIDGGIPGPGDFGGMFYDKVQKRMVLLQRDGFMWGSARMFDTRPPEITSRVPAPSAVEVPRSAVVSVTFNKEMDAATLTAANFQLDNGAFGTVSYDPVSRTATFTPSSLSAATTYTATLTTGIRDASGTPLASPVSFSFTTLTEVGGTISGPTTWVAARSPYVVSSDLTVNSTLSIEPGTVVKFKQNVLLTVNGTLDVRGTPESPVHFTDYRDDSVGGDSNGDGSTTSPSAGWWRGIRVVDGGAATMNGCRIRYASHAYLGYGNYTAPLFKTGTGTVTLTNSAISDSSGYSLYLRNTTATVTIDNTTIQSGSNYGIMMESAGSGVTLSSNTITGITAGDGIRSNNSSPVITGNTISGNAGYGLYVMGTELPSLVSGNTFTGNTSGNVAAETNSSGVVIAGNNDFSGPIHVVAGGYISRDVSWVNDRVYYVASVFTVNAGQTLTIPAGRVVKFAQNVYINVSGGLSAQGTAESPVCFTDYRDDALGGDSNGDGTATTPSAGWWRGIRLVEGGVLHMDHGRIRYAAHASLGYGNYTAPVYKTGAGTVTLTNSTISESTGYSLFLHNTSASATISGNTIQHGSNYGIVMESAGSGVTLGNNAVIAIAAGDGIRSNNSAPVITGNTVSGAAGYGLYVMGTELPSLVSGNTFSGNGTGNVAAETNSSGVVIADDNIFTGPIHIVAGGFVTRDISWDSNRVYYVTTPFTINAGWTLTVPAGRVVKFGQNVFLNNNGTFNAAGESGTPVCFTDYRDDSLGGDSNGDGSATTPAAGWWRGIRNLDGGSANIDHGTFRYGWQGNMGYSTFTAPVYKTGTSGAVNLSNSTISNTEGFGIWIHNSTAAVTINSNTIQNGSNYGIMLENAGNGITVSNNTVTGIATGDGIRSSNSAPIITGNTVSGAAGYGLYVMGTELPSLVSGNTFTGNGAGNVAAEANSSGVVIADDNTFTGPIHIVAGGSVTRDTGWVSNRVYYVAAPFTINAGQTLTIPAGRVVKFAQNVYVNVNGTLNASGVAGNPVTMTDYRDDATGGDSNGDGSATSPAPGWWRGIRVLNGGSANISHCYIRYGLQGNAGYYTYTAPLYKTGAGNLVLADSVVSDTNGHGVWIENSTAAISISNSTLQRSSTCGMYFNNAGNDMSIIGNVIAENGDSGIHVSNSSGVIRENTIRGHSNNGIYLYGANSTPTIFRNTIFGSTNGIRCAAGANPLIGGSSGNGNNIFGNSVYGVWNETPSLEVNADYNWWGNGNGPYHATLNAEGTGNAVSNYVHFLPYLSSPDMPLTFGTLLPASRYFGHVKMGTVSPAQVFTVSNTGGLPMTFSSVALGGRDPGDFRIIADTCSGSSLDPNETCSVTVDFLPAAGGQRLAMLQIASNDILNPTAAATLSGAGSAALPFRDDFTGTLSTNWSILNGDTDRYSLSATPGSLAINTTNSDFAGTAATVQNLFTVPIPDGLNRFVATARLLFPVRPSQNFQQGGIVLLADTNGAPDLDNFVRSAYVFSNGTRYFQTADELNGATTSSQVEAGMVDAATPVYLRISRTGDVYRCEYSTDGTTYTLIREVTGSWEMGHVGIYALNGANVTASSIPVEFDWILVEGDPAASVTPGAADHGTVQVGQTSIPQWVTIGNDGNGNLLISGIGLSGTDAAQFSVDNGSCGALPATIAPGESCTIATTYTPTATGTHTAQLSITTNDPSVPSTTIAITGTGISFRNLTLIFTGTGTGTVVSDPAGIACNVGCTASFLEGTQVTLTMTGSEYTVFNGWSGPCSGTGTCEVTLSANTTVTASIDRDITHVCRIAGAEPVYYPLLQSAVDSAADGSVVEAWAVTFSENLFFDLPGAVTLRGGFNQNYSLTDGMTPVHGTLTISNGTLVIEGIAIH